MKGFNLNVLIVEDDISFALELEMLLQELDYNVIGRVDNSAEALDIIFSKDPDIIFMDIEIKGNLDGVEVGKRVSYLNIPILYITCRKDAETYSEAEESNMIGYMVKPLEKISLKTAIQLAVAKAYSQNSERKMESGDIPSNIVTEESYFFKKKDTYHKVLIKDIAFIRSDSNYCEAFTVNGNSFTARIGIAKLKEMLPAGQFFRTHRQYIVQVKYIDVIDFSESTIKVIGHEVPVSRNQRKELSEMFKYIP